MNQWSYIGDGVYVRFDGFSVLVRKNSHENEESEIALEYDVFVYLCKFGRKSFGIENSDNE